MTTLAMDNYNGFRKLDNSQVPSAYERVWNRSLTERFSFSSKSVSNRIDTALSFLISKKILIKDRLLMADYLANNSGVVTHLYTISNKVAEHFDTKSIELGLFSDPDTLDTPELYCEIITNLSAEEANAQLGLLNRNWILSGDEDLMKLNLTLKFI